MSWVLRVEKLELAEAAGLPTDGPGHYRRDWHRVVRLAPGRVLLANTETGEIREWRDSGLDGLMGTLDFYKGLCERVAVALGPDVLKRWEDGDEGLDLAAEVAALRGIVAGYRRTLSEALNSGDGSYRP